jgi:uncharacterized protein (DUF342 family)
MHLKLFSNGERGSEKLVNNFLYTDSVKELVSVKTEKFNFKLKLSDDRIKLFLDAEAITSPDTKGFPTIEPDEIISKFPAAVIHDCLHKEVIAEVCKELSQGKIISERRVAKGKAAEDGKDGRVIFTVRKMSKKAELQEDQRGYIDFKDLHLFENVRVGATVAKLFPPGAGKPGMDPLGKTLSAKNGKPAKITFDASIKAQNHESGEGQDLVANKEGFLLEESGRISIQEELNISSCVDYKTGSLDFIGSINIRGDVLPGFIVRGKKGVNITGSVSEATITSSEGSIQIKGFLSGSISSKVEAKQEVHLSVAQAAEVYAGTLITVAREARACAFHSGGTIYGEKALMISGEYNCACGLEAKEIGSKLGGHTHIKLANSQAVSEEFVTLEQKIAQHQKALAVLSAHLGPLAVTSAGQSMLSEQHRTKLLPLIEKKRLIEASLIELNTKHKQLLTISKTSAKFRVNSLSKIFPGLSVEALDQRYEVKDLIEGKKTVEFEFDKGEFILKDYQPLECKIEGKEEVKNG